MKSAPQASLGENDKTLALVAGQGVGKWPGLEEAASIECLLCARQHSRKAQSRLLTHGLGRNLRQVPEEHLAQVLGLLRFFWSRFIAVSRPLRVRGVSQCNTECKF